MRRYAIQGRDDYRKYNQLCGSMRQLAHKLASLDPADGFRRKHEDAMLEKLYDMGILGTGGGGRGKLSDIEHKLTVSAFARRRLPVIMTRLRMASPRMPTTCKTCTDSGLVMLAGRSCPGCRQDDRARSCSSWDRCHHRSSISCHSVSSRRRRQ